MGDTTRIFLVRHGQVEAHWRPRIYGDLDVPLSELGRAQAEEAARKLRDVEFSAVVSSGLARAVFGAERVAQGRRLRPEVDEGLREMNRGAWAGLTFAELEESSPGAWEHWHASPIDRRAPGGESLGELGARVIGALDRLSERFAGQTIACIAHSWPIRVAAAASLGLAPDGALSLEVSTGEIVAVDWPAEATRRPTLLGLALDQAPAHGSWFSRPRR